MIIKKQETKCYCIRAFCKCGGEFKRKENVLFLSDPPQYPNICNKCGKENISKHSYPYIQVGEDGEIEG